MSADIAYFESRGMRHLGKAREFADQMHRTIASTPLLEDFTLAEIRDLGEQMLVFEADGGTSVIVQGEPGDYLVILISGTMEVSRLDRQDRPSRIAVVQEGHALGEMSMLDGEPRFASCIALEPTRFAVLDRATLTWLIQHEPRLGAKILVKLVHLLAQRLRNTSSKLVTYMEASRSLQP
jgi:CRP/FNR family cyclic AMP-dependent transcriptional regulator